MKKRTHYILMLCMVVLAAVCGALIPQVNVNSDMTKYLPDNSRMKQGMSIIQDEFGSTQMTGPSIKLMFHDISSDEVARIGEGLDAIPQVSAYTSRYSEDRQYVLFELNVPNTVDQKQLGQSINDRFGGNAVVETTQDGNTPPMRVMIIAAILILLILVLMAQSWLEPLVFLISTGLAVVLNIGTNALLPSVSITTNYIVAILQMVLSLDYSIVLMNRYRQEKTADNTPVEAVNRAIKRAFPSIMSSAATTVVGLIMLVFMRLKIGMDMGIVLAKGVIFSLICTFTVLPSLLMLFHKGIMNTGKWTFVLPTTKLSRFTIRYMVPLAGAAVLLFFFSIYYSKKTDISFSMERDSRISEIFPHTNPVVLVYPTASEDRVSAIADSLLMLRSVTGVYSYPTVMRRQYNSEDMSAQLRTLVGGFSEELPEDLDTALFSPSVINLLYYMNYEDDPARAITFPDLVEFIRDECLDDPMLASVLDDSIREKIDMLDIYTSALPQDEDPDETADTDVAASTPVSRSEVSPKSADSSTSSVLKDSSSAPSSATASANASSRTASASSVSADAPKRGKIRLADFFPALAAAETSFEAKVLASISSRERNNTQMSAQEMSDFIGSTPTQTKMVYSFSKSKSKTMSPLEYVHFLYDDLFERKALASFVSAEQKRGLKQRMDVMDMIQKDASLDAASLATILSDFGVRNINEAKVNDIAFGRSSGKNRSDSLLASASGHNDSLSDPNKVHSDNQPVSNKAQSDNIAESVPDSLRITESHVEGKTTVAVPVKPRKSIEEIRQELFFDMMYSGKAYTASKMASNFRRLGEPIDEGLISLLYVYYASIREGDSGHTMNIEQLVDFISSRLLKDKRLDAYIDDSSKAVFANFSDMFNSQVSKLRTEDHSLMMVLTDLRPESESTYRFIDYMTDLCDDAFSDSAYLVGESVMYSEMKNGFGRELNRVTILTVIAIFLIVAISFRSFIVPLILLMTVMTAVYVNVIFSGFFSGKILYLAYLIVQSILMGATIDYGILYANYYVEFRRTMPVGDAVTAAYKGFIRTVMTSGLIMIVAPGAMALLVDDFAISAIVGSLAVGSTVSVVLILLVVPSVLGACDKLVTRRKYRFEHKNK